MAKNFYEVLSLKRGATRAELVARFHELAKEHHPDRFTGEKKLEAEKAFQDITEAFNVLRNPRRRAQHDMDLDRPTQHRNDPSDLARVYMSRGVKAYKQGNYIEAADNFDRATQADPSNAKAWHHLALTCTQEDRWLPKAQEAIERALEEHPNHAPYVKLAGRIFLKSGMTPRAKEYYNELLRLGGSDAMVRKALEAKGALGRKGPKRPPADEKDQSKSGLFRKMW